jgi:hypothetical protein
MEVTKRPSKSRMLKVDDQEFESMRKFKYLGCILTEGNNITIEIKLVGRSAIRWLDSVEDLKAVGIRNWR